MNKSLLSTLFDETERRPLSVSQLTNQIRGALEGRFAAVWVEGEISNFKAHSSGHWYFTIKDEGAQLRAKCFRGVNTRIRFRPTDGLHVRARGRLTVYPPRGEYELLVESLEPAGAGALRLAFEQLRDRLKAEGLFAPELKRPLPMLPQRVGIVTSPTGAALRDMLNVLGRRTRTVNILLSPARVQGEEAGRDIVRALRLLNVHQRRALAEGRHGDLVDVVIVGRGGGSTEDLWAFNEEEVARAIRACVVPVISAVGHETDFTISDFTADLRAATPSAAAELVAAHEGEVRARIAQGAHHLIRLIRYRLAESRARVQRQARARVFDQVQSQVQAVRQRAERADRRMHERMILITQRAREQANTLLHQLAPARLTAQLLSARRRFEATHASARAAVKEALEARQRRLASAAGALDAMSPLAVLQRGYAIARDQQGRLLRDATMVNVGDPVSLRLAKGRLECRVERAENN
jgi:exodeoxyribonuclease VII large subunit